MIPIIHLNIILKVYNREKSVCKQTSETRTIDVFSTGQKLQVSYAEDKMVSFVFPIPSVYVFTAMAGNDDDIKVLSKFQTNHI